MQAGCAERVTRSGKLGLGIALGLTLRGRAVGAGQNVSGEYGPPTVIVTGNTIAGSFFDGRDGTLNRDHPNPDPVRIVSRCGLPKRIAGHVIT